MISNTSMRSLMGALGALAALFPLASYALSGGQIANPGDFPSTVEIFTPLACTATKIGPRHFITAAHCIDRLVLIEMARNENWISTIVVPPAIGQKTISDYTVLIDRLHFYPHWFRGRKIDLVIIEINQPILDIPDAALPSDVTVLSTNSCVFIGGYGVSAEATALRRDVLKMGLTTAKIGSDASHLMAEKPFPSKLFLTKGDSGGGMFFSSDCKSNDNTIIGVNSKGYLSAEGLITVGDYFMPDAGTVVNLMDPTILGWTRGVLAGTHQVTDDGPVELTEGVYLKTSRL